MSETLNPLESLAHVARVLGDLGENASLPPRSELEPHLSVIYPADLADLVSAAPDHVRISLFRMIPDDEAAAEVLATVDASIQEELLEALSVHRTAELIGELSHDDAADVLAEMDEKEQAQVLAHLDQTEAAELQKLVAYPADTAGGLMTDEFVAVASDQTVRAALIQVKTLGDDSEELTQLFVIDGAGRLVGTVSLEELLRAKLSQPLCEVMDPDPVIVRVDEDQEEVAQKAAHYRLAWLPVVDAEGRPVGLVQHDDLMEALGDEAEEDIFLLAGEMQHDAEGLLERLSGRFPFLLVTIGGTYVVSKVIEHLMTGKLSGSEEHVGILRFIPMIAALAGNAGLQTSTTMIRGFATSDLGREDFRSTLLGEMGLGVVTGFAAALVEFVILLTEDDPVLRWLVPGSQVLSVVLATFFGTVIPYFCQFFQWRVGERTLRIDPALAAGPFITTLNDVASTAIALFLATRLGHLFTGTSG